MKKLILAIIVICFFTNCKEQLKKERQFFISTKTYLPSKYVDSVSNCHSLEVIELPINEHHSEVYNYCNSHKWFESLQVNDTISLKELEENN